MLSEYQKFLNENMSIPAAQDKNPMFYVFTAARLNGKKQDEDIDKDDILKNVMKRVEDLCKELGADTVNRISDTYKPVSIMVELNDCSGKKQIKSAIERIFSWFKQYATSELKKFSDYYRIESAFKTFMDSEELEKFFGSI